MLDRSFGVDLVTFYHPEFWGVQHERQIQELGQTDPERIWVTIMDALVDAGITAIEMTFPPADFETATRAFGSALAFGQELASRGLRLKSGFWGGLTQTGAAQEEYIEQAVEYATFLRDAHADTLVVGLPMRATTDTMPPSFVDLRSMQALSETLHRIGAATRALGVTAALHTEAHSVFCQPRDVDLLMTITDPNFIAFCPDTAHITLSGGDPVALAKRHRERIAIAHWKDASGSMSTDIVIDDTIHAQHRQYMRTLGTGIIDWLAWAELMATTAGNDVVMLELDGTADPVRELVAARTYIEPLWDRMQP